MNRQRNDSCAVRERTTPKRVEWHLPSAMQLFAKPTVDF